MSESKNPLPCNIELSARQQLLGELKQHIFAILSGPGGDAVDFLVISNFVRESTDGRGFEFPVYRFVHRNGSSFTVGCASPGWLVSASLLMPVNLAESVAFGTEGVDNAVGFPDDVLFGSYRDDPNRFTVRFMTTGDVRAFFRRIARAFFI